MTPAVSLVRAAVCTLVLAFTVSLPVLGPPSAAYAETSTVWGWPLQPPSVSRYFDPPAVKWGSGHRGVDLVGAPGQAVLAAGSGTVAFVGMVAGRSVISIDHPSGLRTTYEPVESTLAAGAPVTTGQQIGTLLSGHQGCTSDTCLHWGLRRGTTYLNPLMLINGVQVRLLPLED